MGRLGPRRRNVVEIVHARLNIPLIGIVYQITLYLTMVFSLEDTVPPNLFTYATAVVLSILSRTVMLSIDIGVFENH